MNGLPIDGETVDTISLRIADALERLGLAWQRRDGSVQRVRWRRRLLTESGSLLLLEVDVERLPHGVRADQLTDSRLLHHLSTVVHRPVRVLNTSGITYVVFMDPPAASLPRQADLKDALMQHPGTRHTFPVGAGPQGPVWESLRGHYLVGGETGSGKTTWVLATVLALTQTERPEELQVILVDPKGVDFVPLAGLKHLACPVAVEPDEADQALELAVRQIEVRQRLFLGRLARDLESYNAAGDEKLPALLVVVDEVTDLALRLGLKSRFYKNLIRLSSQGRSFGIHLLLATQNPKAEVLNTLIRGNLAGRIAFRVSTPEHSRTILGLPGAERLPRVPGRLLARFDGRLLQLQGYSVGAEMMSAVQTERTLLDAETRAMVEYARDHLGGRFPQAEIMEAGWTRTQYRQAVVKLYQSGLLRRGQNNAWILV